MLTFSHYDLRWLNYFTIGDVPLQVALPTPGLAMKEISLPDTTSWKVSCSESIRSVTDEVIEVEYAVN